MSKIYIPQTYVNNCNVFNDNYIRSYTNANKTEWVDIYFKDNYALKSGSTTYQPTNVICDTLNTYTTDIYYRYDIADSLIIFYLLCFFIFFIPLKIYTRLFRRFN